MNISFSLFRLQSLDTQRHQITSRLTEIENILASDKAVKAAQEKRDAAEKELTKILEQLAKIQSQVKEKKVKLELTTSSLFGGKIRNPKELQDLQAESEALKRVIAKLEDEELEIMILAEDAQKVLEDARKSYQEVLDKKASQNSLLLGEKSKLEAELPRVDAQREALMGPLEPAILDQYKNLLRTKAGKAVAAVTEGSCGACGVALTPSELQNAKSPSVLQRCRNCGRILYFS